MVERRETKRSGAEVGVTDVLGRERQEDAARSPVAVRPREQVEQGEERGLAAVGDGDVAFAYLPALLAPQELREGAGEAPIPRRPVIVPDRPLERAVALHERLHPHPEDPLRGRDVARIPAAEVDDPAARGHRFAEVVHEQARARLAGQPPAECRKLHVCQGTIRTVMPHGITRSYLHRVPMLVCNNTVSRPPTTLVEAPAIPCSGIATRPHQRSPLAMQAGHVLRHHDADGDPVAGVPVDHPQEARGPAGRGAGAAVRKGGGGRVRVSGPRPAVSIVPLCP